MATTPAAPVSETDAILAATLRQALDDPGETASLASGGRIPVMSSYSVREGEGWATRPLTATALPDGTGKTFVLISDEEAYARAQATGEFGRLSLALDEVSGDTATVHVGRRDIHAVPSEERSGLRPGFMASGSSRIGQFVRSGSSWVFRGWTGWIGS